MFGLTRSPSWAPFIGGRAVALSAAYLSARVPSWNHEAGFGTDLARALLPCSAHLRFGSRSRWAGMRGSEVVAGMPKPAAIGAVERMAFVGGWKAQGRDSHALVLCVEQTRGEARKLLEQWWLGARWTMNASRLRSNKEFSSQLQETKVFDTHGRASSFSSARVA